MQRCLSVTLVAVCLLAVGPQARSADDKLLDTLVTLEKQSWDMIKQRDAAGIHKFATDNFLWVFADGTRVQKKNLEQFLDGYELASYAVSDAEVVSLNAGAAVLVYRVTYTGSEKGTKPVKQTALAMSTYVRRGEAWKSILYQETAVKE